MAATINPKTFPGVYTTITDESFVQPATSRFRPGLIGVATKGPFNTAVAVRSLKEFRQNFGAPLTTSYDEDGTPSGAGFFLADAVAILADMTDGITVVRVGNQYEALPVHDISGVGGSYMFGTSQANLLAPTADSPVYVRIQQDGLPSQLDAKVISVGNGTVSIDPAGASLRTDYTGATLSFSHVAGAANKAESVLYAYSYGLNVDHHDTQVTSVGTIAANKNDFSFDVQTAGTNIIVGAIYKVMEDSKATTHEVRVKSVRNNTVFLETSDFTRVGYQAVAMQDSYTSGKLYRVLGAIPFLWLQATTAGEWANGANNSVGLFVKVLPGSAPGSKKLEIYQDGALVETFDNLSDDPASINWYVTRINNISQYIEITLAETGANGQLYHPANTVDAWDSAYALPNPTATPRGMPVGRVNDGGALSTLAYTGNSGGGFEFGANGATPDDADFIGTIDPNDDTPTGLKCFEDKENVDVNVICAPMDNISRGILQELNRVAKKINAIAIADVPAGLNARLAVDWENGTGQYTGLGRIDSPNIAIYWNWFNTTDPFTGNIKLVPPTLGTLRCMAFTFDRDKPWYAAAGETRGWIPEALSVEFDRVSEDARQAMYGNGNSVNPILKVRGRIVLFGERTLQVAESKLSAVHSVILVNYIVNGLAEIGRRFVFDPNDAQLLVLIRLAFSEFLDKVRNERGVEEYSLVVDDRNNNADTRNQRQVIVDLAIIPTDVAERIFINATVRESGAVLNALNS
jgi:phage tail sheath protein FI